MSVRQYIGARYVPKFYEYNNGVWESNTEYEPLTIVQYNSNSYTSKKTVPANIGNPSENPDYWVVTGNYNAQVEGYRQEVAEYKEDVIELSKTVTEQLATQNENVAEQLATQNNNVAEQLATQNNNVAEQLATQNNNVAEQLATQNENVDIQLKTVNPLNKKWFCFADSYGAFNDSFTVTLKRIYGDRFNYKAQSGMRWMNTPDVTDRYPFKNKLNEWLPTITDKEGYTDILIELGTNDIDSYSANNLITGYNECINIIHSNFPNALIHISIVAKDMHSARWSTSQKIIKLLKTLAGQRYYTTWINGNNNIIGAKNQTWDLLHPTEETSRFIAYCLSSYMISGNCPQFNQDETITDFNVGGQTMQLHEEYSNGLYSIYINGGCKGTFNTTSSGTLTHLGSVTMPILHRAITVNGWINTYLEYLGTTYRNILPASILLIPSDSNNNVDVYLSWAYSTFYRDNNGNAVPWQQEMMISSFTFTGQQTTQIQ